jgi:8-oxo-dGTP diphosphatase
MTKKRIRCSGVIEAAGGLLWRKTRRGRQVALVHRSRYDDWALPKGWREKGETYLETAVREVEEETNCQVSPEAFAGSTSYIVDGVPKVVLYWHMSLTGDCAFRPDEEVDKFAWFTVKKALKKLTYAGEKSLLSNFLEKDK